VRPPAIRRDGRHGCAGESLQETEKGKQHDGRSSVGERKVASSESLGVR
jgi:hypothetical protein